jgi:putative nucleotidyltransferase with HDIG domain
MSSKLSDQLLQKLQSLPALPGSVEQLCHLTSSVETDFDRISQIISIDEALTSKLLQVVNSPFYGLAQKINTVSEAIVTLGFHGVRSLALGISVVGCHGGSPHPLNKPSPLTRENLWRHSLAVATTARKLSGLLQIRELEEVFVGGLLHDIGKIILLDYFHKEYAQVAEEAARGNRSLKSLESEAFGMDHAALGEELCRRWKLPPELARMVSPWEYSSPGEKEVPNEERMLQVIHFGNCIARIASIGFDANPMVDLDLLQIPEAQGIDASQLDELFSTLPEEVHAAEELFGLAKRNPSFHRGHHAAPLEITISIDDPRERNVVRMSLLAMGYCPQLETSVEDGTLPAAAIADGSLPTAVKQSLQENSIPILDFSQWRAETPSLGQSSRMNTQQLCNWLKASLPR